MNRMLALVVCLVVVGPRCTPVSAQFSEVAALAAQRDMEERYKRLAADVQTVLDTQEVLLKRQDEFRQRLDRLSEEIRSLKDDQNRSSSSLVSRDEFRRYVEQLKELDDKRESDKKLILENIRELAKVPAAPPAESRTPARRTPTPAAGEEAPFLHVVKKNQRLLEIIAAYNELYEKEGQPQITLQQVVKANPGLNPDLLIPGQEIRIPSFSKKR